MDCGYGQCHQYHMRRYLSRFQQEKIPVLIGTQMVTKGLNFPNVTLVGSAGRRQLALCTDDFRAAETTFVQDCAGDRTGWPGQRRRAEP